MAERWDVAVVGGGVIGLACSARLAREGLKVVLLERGQCGRSASWAAAGILSEPDPLRKDTGAHLQRQSVNMFPEFCAWLQAISGVDPVYRRCGLLEVYHEDQQWRMAKSRLFPKRDGAAPVVDPNWELLEPAALHGIQPHLAPNILGGMWCHTAAQVRTPRFLQALRGACQQLRVEIREGTTVFALDPNGESGLHVTTDRGEIVARWVIACAGSWTGQLCCASKPIVEVQPVRGQMLLLDGKRMGLTRIIQDRFCYFVPRDDGLLLLGATVEPDAGFDESVTAGGIREMLEAGIRLMPDVGRLPFITAWAGLRPECPDNMPKIGPHADWPNLVLATGHFRNGISLAPLTAEVVADYILTGTTNRLGRWNPRAASQ